MKKEYDFSKMKAKKNPYARFLKKQITIRLNSDTIDYFKNMATELGIPYQVLIDSYLTDCANTKRKLNMSWEQGAKQRDCRNGLVIPVSPFGLACNVVAGQGLRSTFHFVHYERNRTHDFVARS